MRKAIVLATMVFSFSLVLATINILTPRPVQAADVSGSISSDTTWTFNNSPYVLTDTVTVETGATLTVEPGVVVRGQSGAGMVIKGHLQAVGNDGDNGAILFTSDQDTAPDQWVGILIDGGTTDLQFVTVRYGGQEEVGYPASNFNIIGVGDGGQVFIESSEIRESSHHAMSIETAFLHQVQLVNMTFTNNFTNRIQIRDEFAGSILSGTTALSTQFGLDGYELDDVALTIPDGITLTVNLGVQLWASPDSSITTQGGHLETAGTDGFPILFTSLADSAPGQWKGVVFQGGSAHLVHTIIRNSGEAAAGGNITVFDTSPGQRVLLENVQSTDSVTQGLLVYDGSVAAYCATFGSNQGDGVTIESGGTPEVAVYSSAVSGNTGEGVNNDNAVQVDARHNWWGDASGPGGDGPGTGDAVSGNVLYTPWQTESECDLLPFKVDVPIVATP